MVFNVWAFNKCAFSVINSSAKKRKDTIKPAIMRAFTISLVNYPLANLDKTDGFIKNMPF
ncbi:MAG: hypothetical protein CL599_00075 [Alteromonas sp.]|nr:hypothetical protein [Alteromonas sp.]OUX92478.1 MAG: hypothetical protein CBB95_00075 [Alteromonas sp. TMED35]